MESVSELQYSTVSKQLTQEISKEIKKKEGIFFTPPSTVSRHLTLLEPYFKNIRTVLEPCCGSGEFIGGLRQKYPHVKITGIEKNPTIVNSIKNLASPHVDIMEDDFLNHQFSNLFDLIIGNPPFFVIRKKEVPEEYHPFFIGRPNIFILFILKSLSLLKDSGILSFVLPKNFTNCLYYQPTRDLINDNYQIIALEKCHDKYLDTQQETILLILQKKNVRDNYQYRLSLNGYTLFETPESIQQLQQLCTHSTCLQQLGFGVSVGTVVWNQCKDILTDDDSKTTQILKTIFNGMVTPEGLKVDGQTPDVIAQKVNMNIKTLKNRLGKLKNEAKLVGYSRPCYYLTKQGAKQLAVDCVSIRAEVEDYIKSEWGRV